MLLSVAVMRAKTVGDCRPGRTATRNLSFAGRGASEEAMIQLSSQLRPADRERAIVAE